MKQSILFSDVDNDSGGVYADMARTYGLMLWPNMDKEERNKLTTKMSYTEHQDHSQIDFENDTFGADLSKILEETPKKERLEKMVLDQAKKGLLAGDVLLQLFLLDNHGVERPTLEKAKYMVSTMGVDKKFINGSKYSRHVRNIEKHIASFRSVIPLWAAIQMNLHHPYTEHKEIFNEPKSHYKFLQVAALLREFGSSFIPFNCSEPVFSDVDFVTLPAEIDPIRPKGGLPSESWIKCIAKYESSK